jgi:amidase
MRSVARRLSLSLSDDQIGVYMDYMEGSLEAYRTVDAMPDYLPEVEYPRTPGVRPSPEDNKHNAWYVKTDIKGASRGKLKGKTVAIKDNIAVAGVQMMNGASILEGYTPDVDATVVTRILDAGGHIIGKSQCEYYCFSGGSHTSAQGPVENPHKPGHSTGGSSSGSAALLAAGEVDLALGGDQGGSARTPASWCGVVGLKPTWGLVPYTGAMPIESTLDHLGPMSKTVADNALLLEAIAGADGLDPRQQHFYKPPRYTQALDKGVEGLRIGILKEGFGWPKAEEDVEKCVRKAADQFKKLGANVEEVSVPMHKDGPAIWTIIATEGATQQMMKDNGHGFNWKGLYVTSMVDAHSAWRMRADELADTVKYTMMVGEYMIETGRGRHYAKAQNLGRKLTAAYDAVLSEFDVLVMPTTPMKAPANPPQDADSTVIWDRAWENMDNTFSFDMTGHPCLQIPCGKGGDLPIGMMLVGKHYDESTLYRAAHAFEQSADWESRSA